jgi:cytochrome c556
MKKKNIFVVSIIALSLFIASASISFASDREICEKQIDYYLKIKMNDGLLPGDEFNPYDFKGVAASAKAMLDNEKKRSHNDKNHAAISKLVSTHLANIETAASKATEGSVEAVGHSLRFLYLSCKACHKVYETEKRLRP